MPFRADSEVTRDFIDRLISSVEGLPVAVAIARDSSAKDIVVNYAGRLAFQVSQGQNISSTAAHIERVADFCHFFDDREVAPTDLPLQRSVRENRPIGPVEMLVEGWDRGLIPCRILAVPLHDDAGRVCGGMAVLLNLTTGAPSAQGAPKLSKCPTELTWVADVDGTLLYRGVGIPWPQDANDPDRFFGVTGAVHEDDRRHMRVRFRAAIETASPFEATCRLVRGSGAILWVRTHARPLYNIDGRICRWFGTVSPIGGEDFSREVLADRRDTVVSLMQTFDHMPVGVVVAADPSCMTILANEAAHRLLGIARWQNVAKNTNAEPAPLDAAALRNGVEIAHEKLPLERAMRENVEIHDYELDIERHDGATVRVIASAAPLRSADGSVRSGICTLVDITTRHAAERKAYERGDALALVVDRLPVLVWKTDATGQLISNNRAFDRYFGDAPDGFLGREWAAMVHHDDYGRALVRWELAVRTRVPFETELRLRRSDGTYRWFLSRAEPHVEDGVVVAWYGTSTDVGALKGDVATTHTDEYRYKRLIDSNIIPIGIASSDGRFFDANDAMLHLLGRTRAELAAGLRWDTLTPARWRDRDALAVEALRMNGVVRQFEKEYFRADGSRVPVMIGVASLPSEPGELNIFYAVDLSEAKRAEARQHALAQAANLGASLDVASVAHDLAELGVRFVSDSCEVALIDESGRLRFASAATSPDFRSATKRLGTVVPNDDALSMVWNGSYDRPFDSSTVYLALVSAGVRIGAIGFTRLADAVTGVAGTAIDLDLAEALSARGAVALGSARLYERERRITSVLQSSQLPRTLPRVDGYRLDATYVAGNDEALIGGDWYDAFELPDGRVAISIGDVMGKGLVAALAMGKLRQAMQAAAFVRGDVIAMLAAAERSLHLHDADTIATAIAAILDPRDGTIEFSSAGHPMPAIKRDARVERFPATPGPPLGVADLSRQPRHSETLVMLPASSIVFFTDGLIEATRDALDGERHLHATLASMHSVDVVASGIFKAIFTKIVPTDDVAIVVLSRDR